jgi:hypothetical protein
MKMLSKRDSSDSPDQPHQEEDLIDKAIAKLKFHLMSFGFPDCGNLRSQKKKDLRLRIKCIAAMLKQRQKDIELRH